MSPQNPVYSIIISLDSTSEPSKSADIDYRHGDLSIDWVDYHSEKDVNGHGQNGTADRKEIKAVTSPRPEPTSPLPPFLTSNALSPPGPGSKGSKHSKVENGKDEAGPSFPSRRFTQGSTDLGAGIIHLFKHIAPSTLLASLESDDGNEGPEGPVETDVGRKGRKGSTPSEAEGANGTLIALLAVPAAVALDELAHWLGPWTSCLDGMRMIRDAAPNKTIVLLKFQGFKEASDFVSIYTGKPFSTEPSRPESCHPIRIHHLILNQMATKAPLPSLLTGVPAKSISELPTCPVCLERMDSVVTGLVSTPCSHVFHCQCLDRWGESNCPVCHFSPRSSSGGGDNEYGSSSFSSGTLPYTRCNMCTEEQNDWKTNWICVVCGSVGCSRYQGGHARDHFVRTGHAYAMEIDTQRVWDYVDDTYVHRLIQNRTDGKLVELPSAATLTTHSSHSHSPSTSLSLDRLTAATLRATKGVGLGPSISDELKMAQLENITLEYSSLLARQLQQQKQQYDGEVGRLLGQLEEVGRKAGEGEGWRKRFVLLEEKVKGLEGKVVPELEAAKVKAENKTQTITKLARTLQSDLSTEKTLTTALLTRIKTLESSLTTSQAAELAAKKQVEELEEMVADLAGNLDMRERVREEGGGRGWGGIWL